MPQQYLNYFIQLKGGAQVNDTEKNLALLQQGQQALAKNLPEMMKNFKGVSEAVLQDGVLSKKEKELIAVAVGVAIHCEL
jgi:alkylhydroperoxidase/carboxymuconolactone decarboxylase family protein YurZ